MRANAATTVILEAVIAFTHDLFALDIETCKHVSASLGSAVILDRREGNHYFLNCSCEGDPLFLVLLYIHASIAESYLDDV
jgi:hypothetical protein